MQKTQQIHTQEKREVFKGDERFFSGDVMVEMLFTSSPEAPFSVASVSFEKGARTAWHTHPKGQRLIVTEGIGYTQEWGKPIEVFHKGDVISCPPNVKHWHGASKDCKMTHIAITGEDENGKAVEWLQKVSDEDYAKADLIK